MTYSVDRTCVDCYEGPEPYLFTPNLESGAPELYNFTLNLEMGAPQPYIFTLNLKNGPLWYTFLR